MRPARHRHAVSRSIRLYRQAVLRGHARGARQGRALAGRIPATARGRRRGQISLRQGGRTRAGDIRGLRRILGPGHAPVRADEEVIRSRAYAWCVAGAIVAALMQSPAQAQGRPDPGEIRGLKLGLKAKSMTLDGFGDLACGSNGGPPRQKLEEWSEFGKCRPEDNGLHEVYARFDDEDEYIGKAIEEPRYARGKTGTRVAGHPVILSALFDRDGVLRVLRFVTDPRAPSHERRMAHLLRLAAINRYEPDGWTCTDFPPAEGETPVGGVFIKQHCEKTTPERHLIIETRFLRKPGQSDNDPVTGEYRAGAFESSTRFEILDPSYKRPTATQRTRGQGQ